MGRRKSRETALQILFQLEFNDIMEERSLDRFWKDRKGQNSEYVQELISGVVSNKDEIDSLIQAYSKNWRLSRMLCIDRNIMRLAVYELLFGEGMPVAVAINEAVELAKKFGGNESAKFINGLLDALSKEPRIQKKSRGNTNE
ncbi:MAG: transcription antitermination factor NusB [Candidatus Aminicenantes bacterium]|nr:transcription antitermination factor NusB [Candidatus Aminicenantes bacterium]HHF52276.1 transcription antitermination factor NusB [Candidatus Aminicenantes bacterium]